MSNQHRIVSSDSEQLILVDSDDTEIGYRSKAECHDGNGVLHRAFSLFLFDHDGALLLQQRSREKRLWPGFWSNSCCSHPRQGETLAVAAERRLSDELNVAAELEYAYHFCYQAQFEEEGSEHELCHVFLGRVEAKVRPNESEIDAIQTLSVQQIDEELRARPETFTPWFKQEWQTLQRDYARLLSRYAI